jgi:cellobiose epimerase
MNSLEIVNLKIFKKEILKEYKSILLYWMQFTLDETNGGYYGSINNDNIAQIKAPKGIVLNSRILWSFSAAYLYFNNTDYKTLAHRAYQYIIQYFVDKENGGVYWSVDNIGKKLDTKKQIYGLAFCIYGLSEYYKINKDVEVLELCKKLYLCIEKYSFDKNFNGYIEALTHNWQPINDLRLSAKDANEKKTMNTHLHIIEAYANLYTALPIANLKQSIRNLLQLFITHFVNAKTGHLILFFSEEWETENTLISYGHDIEAAWLLLNCAEIIEDTILIKKYKELALQITNAALEGFDNNGGMWYELENDILIKEKHWWPQAEAMIGLVNAYQLSNDKKYLDLLFSNWNFIKTNIKDKKKGEWFWGVDENNIPMPNQDKAGFWKCPYHNTRACLELLKRVKQF